MLTICADATVRAADPVMAPRVAVMVAVPVPELVASPSDPTALLTIATVASDVDHVTDVVMSLVVPSVYVPVAANCCALPSGMVAAAGVTSIETSAAGVTVSDAVDEIDPIAAVTVTDSTATLVANPAVAGALLRVAIVPSEELQ